MIDPAASLHADIEVVDRALKPFSAPQVNEYAGLRWMERALRQRRAHIMEKIAAAEQSTLTLHVRTATGSPAVRATTLATLVSALQQQLQAAGDELDWPRQLPRAQREWSLQLDVDRVLTGEDRCTVVLQRPAGPLSAQPLTADGANLAFDAALTALLDRLTADDARGDLGVLVAAEGLTVELVTSPATGPERRVVLDRHTAPSARPVGDDDV